MESGVADVHPAFVHIGLALGVLEAAALHVFIKSFVEGLTAGSISH